MGTRYILGHIDTARNCIRFMYLDFWTQWICPMEMTDAGRKWTRVAYYLILSAATVGR